MRFFSIVLVGILIFGFLVSCESLDPKQPSDLTKEECEQRRQEITEEFLHAWNNYKLYAWGNDELKPISKSPSNFIFSSATIVSALDTMMLMGLDSELTTTREWILYNYTINTEKTASLFETNIRILGGFLGAYSLSGDKLYLLKAQEVAESFLPAFETEIKVPNIFYSPQNPFRYSGQATLASAGTLQLEFCYLSLLTENPIFCEKARHFYTVIEGIKRSPKWNRPLYPLIISTSDATVEDQSIGIGGKADSFYEYLVKVWAWNDQKDTVVEEMWKEAIQDINSILIKQTEKQTYTFIGRKDSTGKFIPEMEHLTCFYGGLLVLLHQTQKNSVYLSLAHEIARTCTDFYLHSPQFVSADSYFFENESFRSSNPAFYLRPETLETLFYLWRETHDPIYRDWGWKIFQGFKKSARVPNGYSGIRNVDDVFDSRFNSNGDNPDIRESIRFFTDKQEAFLLSETWKYAFLLFADDDVLPLSHFVFNTEAHPFLKQASIFLESGACLNCNKYYHPHSDYENQATFWFSPTLIASLLLTGLVLILYLVNQKRNQAKNTRL